MADPSPSPGFFAKAIESNFNLLRFVVLCAALSAIGGVTIWVVVSMVRPKDAGVRIEFKAEGATLILEKNQPSKALFLLPSNQLWVDTGLTVPGKSAVCIKASGRVNLAVHRLVEAAKADERPIHAWTGPEGGDATYARPVDADRNALLVDPQAKPGALLAFLRHQGEAEPSKQHFRPDGIQFVGKSQRISNEKDADATLWLVINDAVLGNDEKSRLAYLEPRPRGTVTTAVGTAPKIVLTAGETVRQAEKQAAWEHILAQQYFDLWYDDNVGDFLVNIDFKADECS